MNVACVAGGRPSTPRMPSATRGVAMRSPCMLHLIPREMSTPDRARDALGAMRCKRRLVARGAPRHHMNVSHPPRGGPVRFAPLLVLLLAAACHGAPPQAGTDQLSRVATMDTATARRICQSPDSVI